MVTVTDRELPSVPATRTATVAGASLRYRAQVSELLVTGSGTTPSARYVYTEYLLEGSVDPAERPVVFAFNGGPGSSSVWLHFGVGPRRVADADTLDPRMTPPFSLIDNDESLLNVADLVFVDPAQTGFSRLMEGADPREYFGIDADARAMLDFVMGWARRNRRERSPRFLLAESYGTVRAARMIRDSGGGPTLGGRTRATGFTGAILVGPALTEKLPEYTGDLQRALETRTLAASAWHHGLVERGRERASHIARAAAFGRDILLPLLVQGSSASPEETRAAAETLSQLVGITVEEVTRRRLRIDAEDYMRLALGDDRQLGAYDSRYTLPMTDAGNDSVADDPAMGRYAPGFLGAIEAYLRDELDAPHDEEYLGINFLEVNRSWDWERDDESGATTFGEVAQGLRRDPRFEVLICTGAYDLVTTTAAARYAIDRHEVDRSRVHQLEVASGHMPYLGREARREFADTVRHFITRLSTGALINSTPAVER